MIVSSSVGAGESNLGLLEEQSVFRVPDVTYCISFIQGTYICQSTVTDMESTIIVFLQMFWVNIDVEGFGVLVLLLQVYVKSTEDLQIHTHIENDLASLVCLHY